MTNLKKVKISRLFASGIFWIATVVSYLQFRGVPLENVYEIVSLYSISVVVLEYPTGVIGDYFGHKKSVLLGYLITSLSFFLMSLPGPQYFYYLIIFLGALGVSLTSGSDIALLHKVSDNYKKDLANINSQTLIVVVGSMTLASIIAKYYPFAPTLLSSLSFLGAAIFVGTISNKSNIQTEEKGNIFHNALNGLKETFQNSKLLSLILFSSFIMMFFSSFKWFYNPLFETLSLNKEFWGISISILTLLTGLGTQIYGKLKKVNIEIVIILLVGLTFLVGITFIPTISYISLPLLFITIGISQTKMSVEINKQIDDTNRASILSLKSLIGRLLSAVYVLGAGYLINNQEFIWLFGITALLLFAAGILISIERFIAKKET